VAHFAGSRSLAFAIKTSRIQGKGAFATRRIQKGARVIEYLGECIDEDEADIRYPDDEMGRHHTFLFSIGDGTRVLDAGPIEWPAKFINHSCEPNCEAIEEDDGRVFISALKTISVGTELTYDYAYERTDEHTVEDEQMYVCRCGSATCRGTIMAAPTKKQLKKMQKRAKAAAKEQAKKNAKRAKKTRKSADGHAHVEMHAHAPKKSRRAKA
jgi:uncharacterized protein